MAKKNLNKVYNQDSRKITQHLDSKVKIKATITSPPYFDMKDYGSDNQVGYGQKYEDYLEDLKNIFEDIFHITDDEGTLWIVIDTFKRENNVVTLPFDLTNKLKESGWLLQDIIIWKKDKTVPWSQKGFVQRKFEYILFFSKTSDFLYNKDRVRNFDTDQLKKWWVKYPERYNPRGKAIDEIWEFPIPVQGSWGDEYIRHFCPLPKEMVATIIDMTTNEGDIVLDPFSGSGSVLFQSAVMNRNYIGFELNSDYIKMFESYLQTNLEGAINEYKSLQINNGQNEFMERILNLRALKYGRLLVNSVKKELKIEIKVLVKILRYLTDSKKHIEVEYLITGKGLNVDDILSKVDIISKKQPLSKFGIVPKFSVMLDEICANDNYYTYTSTNSYCYSDLPIDSSKVKVISEICVNLNENDYS